MKKILVAMCAAAVAGFGVAGSATEVSAAGCCGTPAPRYVYRTVSKVSNVTRYRDVQRVNYVTKIQPVYHVTRVQPVVRVHTVTRVNYRTVAVVKPVHMYSTQMLPARTIHTSSVQVTRSGCAC